MILMIDNFDSFTYNLVQYIEEQGVKVIVRRNNAITIDQIRKMKPEAIVISPGPGTPEKAGISVQVIKTFAGKIPILGVCLGHQSIAYAFGGRIIRARKLMHGKTSEIYHDNKTIYQGIRSPFTATRYHSLIVDKKSLPKDIYISSHTSSGIIMGLRHKYFPLEGVQFHPESILTKEGKLLLKNFLTYYGHHSCLRQKRMQTRE